MVHPLKVLNGVIREALPKMIDDWQNVRPDCLLPTAYITAEGCRILDVSRPTISRHLTNAVHEGWLIEVLMRRDRLVILDADDLPPLYAIQDENVYELTPVRPDVRGSDGVSFIVTPKGFERFLRRQKTKQRHRVPSPRSK